MIRRLVLLALALLVAGQGLAADEAAGVERTLHTERINQDGVRTGQRFIAAYIETSKVDGESVRREVADVYDWDAGLIKRFVLGKNGVIVSSEVVAGALGPRPDEIEEAIEITRRDPEIAGMINRRPSLSVGGGFLLVHDKGDGPCVIGTRCLQIIVGDGPNELRRVIVDLKSRRIVAQDYFMPAGGEGS